MPGEMSAIECAKVIQSNFSTIDGDGSNTISRDELDRYSNDPRRSKIERNAAADFLAHFDLVKEMATTRPPSNFSDSGSSHYGSMFADGSAANSITKRDVNAMLLDYSDSGIDKKLGELRTNEVKDGAFKVGLGAVLTVGGAVLTAGTALEFPPVAVLPAAVAAGGVVLMYSGARDLWGRASEPMRAQYEQRRDALESW